MNRTATLLHVGLTLIAIHDDHESKLPRVDTTTTYLLLQSGSNVGKADSMKISDVKTNIVTVKSIAEILCSKLKKIMVVANKAKTIRVLAKLFVQYIAYAIAHK